MQEDSTLQAISTRQLLWDEENRLLGISDNGFVSQYWYDASGERTVKESFDNEGVYVNGALSGARTGTSKFTAYISPYMVVSQGGNYTKHVYMGSQRITSKVSNSRIFGTSPVNTTDLQAKLSQQTTKIKERFDSLGVQYSGLQQTGGLVSASPAITADSYFYHPDHLGSSSLITSGSGDLVQHIQYVPFGEVFVEERNATWSTPYKFNGKEQDEETGLCYYGARYYDPRASVWLSVDPLAEKYPNVGSYVYCVNNPVKFVDPDGRDLIKVTVPANRAGTKSKTIIVDSRVASNFHDFAWAANKELGLVVGSSFRSKEHQKGLRDKWDRGDRNGLWCRPAKTSPHSAAFAVDLNVGTIGLSNSNKNTSTGQKIIEKLNTLAESYGMSYLGGKDIGHFYLEPSKFGYKDRNEAIEVNDQFNKSFGENIPLFDNNNNKNNNELPTYTPLVLLNDATAVNKQKKQDILIYKQEKK